ncbi:MAG: hypothetical protein Q8R96_03880 [Bacteroidota bacterium]|nr:hypothetical protein [Bacteroidota bacterium]
MNPTVRLTAAGISSSGLLKLRTTSTGCFTLSSFQAQIIYAEKPDKLTFTSFNIYVKQKAVFRAVYDFFEAQKLLRSGVKHLRNGATNHLNGEPKLLCGD